MHHSIRVLTLVLGGALLFAMAACDDPSNVGLGVGSDLEGGHPDTLSLRPTPFESTSLDDITSNASRILMGSVQDPVAGQITADGFLDVSAPASPSADFLDGPIESAELELFPEYVYGDTLETVTMGVYAVSEEWPATGMTSDTTLASSEADLIRTFEFTPTDSVVTVEMPDAWVTANDEVLRDTSNFADDFHGFRVAPVSGSGNAVVGIDAFTSTLRATVGENTTAFPAAKTFSGLARSGGTLPDHRMLVQDGTGAGVSFSFTLPDSLHEAPLNRAAIHLPADTTALGTALPENPDFVRPRPTQVRLLGIPTGEDSPVTISNLSIDSESRFVLGGTQMLTIFQQELLNNPQIERFLIQLDPDENTVNGLLLHGPDAPDQRARAYLTVTLSE